MTDQNRAVHDNDITRAPVVAELVPPSEATTTNGYSSLKARWPDNATSEAPRQREKGEGQHSVGRSGAVG